MHDIPMSAPGEPDPTPSVEQADTSMYPTTHDPAPDTPLYLPQSYGSPAVPESPAPIVATDSIASHTVPSSFGAGGLPLEDSRAWAQWAPPGDIPPLPPYPGVTYEATPPGGSNFGYGGWQPPRQREPRSRLALVALALLAMLGIGFGAGALVVSGRAAPATGGGPSVRQITIGASSAPVSAVSSGTTALQQSIEQVVQSVQPSVVEVTSTSAREEAIGSGDILSTDGYIVTNDHVVQGFDSYTVTLSSGKTLPAQVVGEDAQDDLAVLKVSASNLKPIAIGDSAQAHVGEFALAVGNPLGLQQSATFGIVSALNRTASEAPSGPAGELTGLIQTSAPINPGNSGGALVDLQGRLIGIPTLGATDSQTGGAADGIGFAIPSDRVQYVATQLIQHGQLVSTGQGFLGIQSEDVTPQIAAADGLSAQSGVLVVGFVDDASGASPARQGGLRAGDIIVAVNGQQITDGNDLASALLTQQPGTRVSITIVRGQQQRTVSVTLGERPANLQG